jgi:hypothetical protein
MERLHSFRAACVESSSAWALEKLQPLPASAALSAAASPVRIAAGGGFACAADKGTEEVPAGGSALGIVFDGFLAGVAVVAPVGQDVACGGRQVRDFGEETATLADIGWGGRGQQGKDQRVGGGGNHRLETVPPDPFVVVAVAPTSRTVHPGRRSATGMPHRTSGGDEALVDGHHGGVGQALGQGFSALQADGLLKQAMGLAIADEIGAACREVLEVQPGLEGRSALMKEPILCRFGGPCFYR